MNLKPSCRSQFLAIRGEVEKLLEQGYSHSAIYRYFRDAGKIDMTLQAFNKVLANPASDKPFSSKKLGNYSACSFFITNPNFSLI